MSPGLDGGKGLGFRSIQAPFQVPCESGKDRGLKNVSSGLSARSIACHI